MKRLLAACIIVLFISIPVLTEAKEPIDYQIEIAGLKIKNVELNIKILSMEFIRLNKEKDKLGVELQRLQAEKKADHRTNTK